MAAAAIQGWCMASMRQNKGISLEQISEVTKLKISTLQAIEEGNFDVLPGGIYNISYIRQFARAIEADETELVAMYRMRYPVGA